MTYFIDFIPGNNKQFLLLDLGDGSIEKKSIDDKHLLGYSARSYYCFDLYKYYNFFGLEDTQFVWDLQSLYGLKLERCETIEELFDKQTDKVFFDIKEKINAHIKSYLFCKISLKNYSLTDVIPADLFESLYKEKANCIMRLFKNNVIPKECLTFYRKNTEEIKSIIKLSNNVLFVDKKPTKLMFNIFGAKNSRMSLRKSLVNIYNLSKDKRASITPPEGFKFAQFDYKSFQPRLALSLFGDASIKQQLRDNEDIYSLFEGDREANKLELISWMFSNRKNPKFDTKLASLKDHRYRLYHDMKNNSILTPFERPLFFSDEEENVMFQNYICSTEADCIMSLINHLQNTIKDTQSYLILPFYDCLIYCIKNEECAIINELKGHMENYLYERFEMKFPVSIKVGNDLLNLENYNVL